MGLILGLLLEESFEGGALLKGTWSLEHILGVYILSHTPSSLLSLLFPLPPPLLLPLSCLEVICDLSYIPFHGVLLHHSLSNGLKVNNGLRPLNP